VSSDRINSLSTNSHPSTTKAIMNSLILGPTKLTTLPAATVQKIINEVLASKAADENAQSMSFAKETRDLLIECCVEFITMISTEANEIAEKDAKKTIACEHITKALEELGFGEYVQEIMAVADQFKTSQVVRIPLHFQVLEYRKWHRTDSDFAVAREEAKQDGTERHVPRGARTHARRALPLGRRQVQCSWNSLRRLGAT
jgi:histone H3/H4